MKLSSDTKAAIGYIFSLLFPVILAVGITDNTNETAPLLYWILCPALFFCVSFFAFPGELKGEKLKWTVWSVVFGLAEALALTSLV